MALAGMAKNNTVYMLPVMFIMFICFTTFTPLIVTNIFVTSYCKYKYQESRSVRNLVLLILCEVLITNRLESARVGDYLQAVLRITNGLVVLNGGRK